MTYEEAYFVFGFGPTLLEAMSASISPWLTESELKIRLPGKSTLLAWRRPSRCRIRTGTARVRQVDAGRERAAQLGQSNRSARHSRRRSLRRPPRQADDPRVPRAGQYAAYYPDSTSSSRDKKNVRDGHYTVWSPTIWMENVDAGGAPTNDDAHYVIDLIAGHTVATAPNFAPNVTVANVGLVPDCAMRVDRMYEGGPLSLYVPPVSCTCEFENAVDSSSCETCVTTTCSHGTCRNGYCEEF